MKKYLILSLILGLDALFLLLQTSELSISYAEITLLNGDFSLLQQIERGSLYLFGQNDFALRSPMIVLHLLSTLLLFRLSKKYLKYESDRLWLVVVFILLPGVLSASIVVNNVGLVIFSLFLYLNFYDKNIYWNYLLLAFLWFISPSMMLLFLALFIYALKQKEYRLSAFNAFLFLTSLLNFGFDTTGLPQGHFLDTLAIFSAIFTPIVFVYIFYILYRRYITSQEEIVWYISATALLLALFLSFRQRLHLENFAPYILLSILLGAQTFYHSYRVRLKQFRATYKVIFVLSLIFLFFNATVIFFNKSLYLILKDPQEHFAYEMHVAKDLAVQLKEKKIPCIDANDKKLQARLEFYGVGYCENYLFSKLPTQKSLHVTISYKGSEVYETYVTNINKNPNK